MLLLPNIDSILEATQEFTINKEAINDVLSKTHSLRNEAARANLIEPLEISREALDKDSLKMQFTALVQKLDLMRNRPDRNIPTVAGHTCKADGIT